MSDQQFARSKASQETGQLGNPGSAPRVLVVDDDPGIRLLMNETLAKAGFDVSEAASGVEAIEHCRQSRPDLMLLDISMPSMDGITVCSEVRRQSGHEFPIIMVTGVDDSESIQRAFGAGATDFILKPVNWPLFQRRLDTVLTEWNRAREFDASNDRARLLEKVAPEEVMLVARSGVIIEDLKQHRAGGVGAAGSPQTLDQLYGPEIGQRMQQRISGVLKTGRPNTLEFAMEQYGALRNFEAQFLVEGRDRVMIVVQDISVGEQEYGEIYDLAFFDTDTQLPNRNLFEQSAEDNLANARLQGRNPVFFSLCFDGISDNHLDDRNMMRAIAERLDGSLSGFENILKLGKSERALHVARIDSRRFMFILQHAHKSSDASTICDHIAREFMGQINTDAGPATVSPHLGIAQYPADGPDLGTIMHAAAAAMQEALETGSAFCLHSHAAAEPGLETQDYGNELRQALDKGELELFFQPRLSLPNGKVTCVEALLRWNHPLRGYVDLRELLYLAKASGLMVQLGNWVLGKACEAASGWQCDPLPRVSINLSQQEFSRQDLADRVIDALERTGLEPGRMELELTEAALLRASDGRADLQRLKDLGVGLVLDNFGTGHSSLANLKQYPVDALKIDGSFVRGLIENEKDAAVCEVIITMAHLFGMKVVAEGVESEAQLQRLMSLGCDEYQGFHLCKPMPASEIRNYLLDRGRSS
jgi:EAL domain-containing protein (putative c-di-GMP-specific phosphodiesterase class I)/PleD family two-component response regulator